MHRYFFFFPLPHSQIILQEKKDDNIAFILWFFLSFFLFALSSEHLEHKFADVNHPQTRKISYNRKLSGSQQEILGQSSDSRLSVVRHGVIWQLAFTVQKNKCDAFRTLFHPKS